jgi:hypothetical protein
VGCAAAQRGVCSRLSHNWNGVVHLPYYNRILFTKQIAHKSSKFIESKIAQAFQSNKSAKFLVVLYLKLLSISINFLMMKLGSTAMAYQLRSLG